MISRSSLSNIFLILYFIGIFNIFSNTPINNELSFLFSVISTYGHFKVIFFPHRFNRIIIRWYLVGISLMLCSLLTSYFHYNQNILDSFIATQRFYKVGLVILLYDVFKSSGNNLKSLYSLISKFGWFFVLFIVIYDLLGFNYTYETISGKIISISIRTFNKTLFNFIGLFYLNKFIVESKFKYIFLCVLLFSLSHVYEVQRVLLIVQIGVILLFLMISKRKILKFKFSVFILILILPILSFYSRSESSLKLIDRFQQMSKYVYNSSDSRIEDNSTAIRIFENKLALEYFSKHPLFGNGYYRSKNKIKVVGDNYFYPLDIGLIGILFSLGLCGIIIFIFQIKHCVLKFRYSNLSNVYSQTSLSSLIFLLIFSISAGTSINDYFYFFFLIIMTDISSKYQIYNYNLLNETKKHFNSRCSQSRVDVSF